jgi:AraC-like DNA-binding protein
VQAQPGELLSANPGEVHDGRPYGGPMRRWRSLYFPASALREFTGGREVAVTQPVIADAQLRAALLASLARLANWKNDGDALACEESLVDTWTLLLARHGSEAPSAPVAADVTRVRECLADDLAATPTLARLACVASLSRFQVLRRFRQAYGLPPHAWLQQQRAERARALIRNGTSLAETANASGFADQSHMTRVFVRHFGFTPGAWRNGAGLQ